MRIRVEGPNGEFHDTTLAAFGHDNDMSLWEWMKLREEVQASGEVEEGEHE